jgi:hypothetical protein
MKAVHVAQLQFFNRFLDIAKRLPVILSAFLILSPSISQLATYPWFSNSIYNSCKIYSVTTCIHN